MWKGSTIKKNKPGTNSQIEGQNKQLKWTELRATWWASWTKILQWDLFEEFNPKLSWTAWANIFDKMRRSDSQVSATLLVCELPIKATKWRIDAVAMNQGEEVDEKAEEIAQFVANCLFKWMEKTWSDVLSEILSMLQFWFSVMEKTYTADGDSIIIKNLWYRQQTSITKWEGPNNENWITQQLVSPITDPKSPNFQKQSEVFIPWSKLLIFSNDKKWDNYEWISILRPSYKNWFLKDKFYKFDAVRQERQAVWIPVIYMPSWTNETEQETALKIVQDIRSSEQTWVVLPGSKDEWWLFEFADLKASDSTDIFTSIDHHNREITKSILAQFIELWNTESWSRALWETQQGFFLEAIQAVATNIADVINRYLIPELVQLNFDDVTQFPELRYDKIWNADWNTISTSIASLVEKWIISPDDDLEQFMREAFNLPQKVFDQTIDRSWSKKETPESKNPITKNKAPSIKKTKEEIKTDNEIKEEIKANECWHDHWHIENFNVDEEYMEFSAMFNNRSILDIQNSIVNKEDLHDLKKKGLKFNDFEKDAFRPLTFAERKVNLSQIKRETKKAEKSLSKAIDIFEKERKLAISKSIARAVKDNDVRAINKIKTWRDPALAAALTDVQKEMFDLWKKWAATEMWVAVPPTSKEVKWAMRAQNEWILSTIWNQIDDDAKMAVNELIANRGWDIKNLSSWEALAAASTAVTNRIAKARSNLLTAWVMWSVNTWRTSIFERFPEQIHAMQYSAILDDKTTKICQSLDWRVVKAWSPEFFRYSPPRHFNCRSIWVEILKEETFKPKITWVPKWIPSGNILNVKEMKAPILLKWSPAIATLKTEIKERKSKILILKKSWQFPNRLKQHEDRINLLEKSIKKAAVSKFKEELEKDWILFN